MRVPRFMLIENFTRYCRHRQCFFRFRKITEKQDSNKRDNVFFPSWRERSDLSFSTGSAAWKPGRGGRREDGMGCLSLFLSC